MRAADRMAPVLRAALRVALAAGVLAVAFGARQLAVGQLPVDFDEDDYLRAGQLYAAGFRENDLSVLLDENYRQEHPPLSKIVTGLAIAPLEQVPTVPDRPTTAPPDEALPRPHLDVARTAHSALGAVAAFALALLNPIAGFLLAIHTWTIKYTSQVMLEAPPALAAVLAALAATAAWRAGRPRQRAGWLAAAGVFFGLACAGKYLYGVVGLAIAADWLWRTRPSVHGLPRPGRIAGWLAPVAGWFLLAFATFLAAAPFLWPDPVGRLAASIGYHGGYAGSEAVTGTGWPFWQPIVWLLGSVPFNDPSAFLFRGDLLITGLAVAGLAATWREQRVFALWLLVGLGFLLVWPTKWPQYLLVVSAPLSVAAALGARRLVLVPAQRTLGRIRASRDGAAGTRASRDANRRGRLARDLRGLVAAAPWLAPGLIALLVLIGIPLLYEGALAVTDMTRTSLRDGLNGGVLREAIGGLTGQVDVGEASFGESSEVHFVGLELLGGLSQGFWLGFNSTAFFLAFSLLWTVASVGAQAGLGVLVALALSQRGVRLGTLWRTLFILPWMIPEFVGAVVWLTVLHPTRGALSLLGGGVNVLGHPDTAVPVLLVVATWIGFPLMMLVALAGLRTIPRTLDEAAVLDGASAWSRFRFVTLPLLMPLLAPAFVIRAIAAFNQFYLFYVLRPPVSTVATFSFDVFGNASGPGLYSVAAAINILTLVALAVVVAWFVRWRARAEQFLEV